MRLPIRQVDANRQVALLIKATGVIHTFCPPLVIVNVFGAKAEAKTQAMTMIYFYSREDLDRPLIKWRRAEENSSLSPMREILKILQ